MSYRVRFALRCTRCHEPTPAQWIDDDDECPWCATDTARRCSTCGVPVVPDYVCPCNRTTRQALDDAEELIQAQEADSKLLETSDATD